MNPSYRPAQVVVDKAAQTLMIAWADQHETTYPLDGLRRACPCATCQGGHARMGSLPDPALFKQPARRRWERLRLEPAGNYALRFIWDDGHDAGIYTWQRLRVMCPCTACRATP